MDRLCNALIFFGLFSKTVFTPEELVGMLFDYCREISEEYAGIADSTNTVIL